MVDAQRQRLRQGQVKSMLARKLKFSVDEALKRALENEMGESFGTRLSQMANAYAKRAGNSVYFAHKNLFESKGQAQQLAASYFKGEWGGAMKNALYQRKYYKTPHGGIVFIPRGEVTYYNEDGAVYALKVNDTEYFWDFREELYYDLYGNVYNPHGKVIIGNRTPRYIKEAYKTLCKVKVKHPNAYIDLMHRYGRMEAFINIPIYIPETDIHTYSLTTGPTHGVDFFSTDIYPEVGTGESFIPIWGSGKQAYYDFEDGDYGWAAFNTGMAISDVFLVRSIFGGLGKAVMKNGVSGGTKHYFGYGMSHNYGASVARWKRLGVDMSGIKHHWAISQDLMKKYPWLKPIGNQTWNLKRFGSQATHMRWGHGTAFPSEGLSSIYYWKLAYPVSSTPLWFRLSSLSTGGQATENYWRNE